MNCFGENLMKYRKLRKRSRNELAIALGVTAYTVAYYEQGRREPNIERLLKISKFLSVSVDDLLDCEIVN